MLLNVKKLITCITIGISSGNRQRLALEFRLPVSTYPSTDEKREKRKTYRTANEWGTCDDKIEVEA